MLSSSLQRSHDANGEDIVGTDPNFVIRYMTHPFEYENLTLLQMAKKHYFSKNRRHKSKVESIVRIILELDDSELLENSENWELYCRQQVLFHHYYHSLAKAIGECETWTLRYIDLGLAMNDCVNITDLVDEEYEETEDIDLESEGVLLEEMFDYGEDVELWLRDFDTSHNWGECLERYPNIDIERKFIHNHLGITYDCNSELANNIVVVPLTHLSAQQRMAHDLVLTSLYEQRPIHLIISGGESTEKSTLINTIVHSAFILFHSNKAVRIMAPTGFAAFIIGGATIHHEQYDCNSELANNVVVVPLTHLSAQQRMAHDLVLTSLHEQRPIHLIISGGESTENSTLINTIVHSAFILFHSNKAVRIMAPTGFAAFNIGGATIHHELAISVERKPSQPYIHISGDQCRRMQEDFKDTKLIIIDEYNMLVRAMLANIDLRCRDIFATNESFGRVFIILVGDMRQLPLIFDSLLYSNKGSYIQQSGTLAYSVFDKCTRLSYIF
ncbi:ATP-dependent DNA helicase [Abeliophyllum distichum]|uniref:ATP-dependent DNA helicase n=1 Tax=Abeliophyllum distichum TaxID=126358 RepID=A0ABD1RTL3_9LAMI